ncbi:MAG: hypothetical protein HYV07_04865 [Deltaproteobacteria bacterium]|nr:hypothetical protein [Deltaproteobacteria bacterium]
MTRPKPVDLAAVRAARARLRAIATEHPEMIAREGEGDATGTEGWLEDLEVLDERGLLGADEKKLTAFRIQMLDQLEQVAEKRRRTPHGSLVRKLVATLPSPVELISTSAISRA